MLSLPKNSLAAKFSFYKYSFMFELMPKGHFEWARDTLPDASCRILGEFVPQSISTNNLHIQCEFDSLGTPEFKESIWKIFYFFSKTFKKSKFIMEFGGVKEEFAMEIMRFARGNGFLLDRIKFSLNDSSPESIQELLNGCQEQHIRINTEVPEGFKCTPPPGGYKFESFVVYDAHWVNLDDFLQCREVYLWDGIPNLTMEYLNGLFKKIVNLECRIEKFTMDVRNHPCDFAQIVRGLSESEIQRDSLQQTLQFERKDGLKLVISLYRGYYLKMTVVRNLLLPLS
ncbi:unnamed protein product [Caenorhabditis brenneri]